MVRYAAATVPGTTLYSDFNLRSLCASQLPELLQYNFNYQTMRTVFLFFWAVAALQLSLAENKVSCKDEQGHDVDW